MLCTISPKEASGRHAMADFLTVVPMAAFLAMMSAQSRKHPNLSTSAASTTIRSRTYRLDLLEALSKHKKVTSLLDVMKVHTTDAENPFCPVLRWNTTRPTSMTSPLKSQEAASVSQLLMGIPYLSTSVQACHTYQSDHTRTMIGKHYRRLS